MLTRSLVRLGIVAAIIAAILVWSTVKDANMERTSRQHETQTNAPAIAAPINIGAPTSAPGYFMPYMESPSQWLDDTLNIPGITIPANVHYLITDLDNCGSKISPNNTGGGCTSHNSDGTITVRISPTAIYTMSGIHIIFHELGHALGIKSECSAEAYAHQYSAPDVWSYPSCARGIEPTTAR
jgi:hypothetical protein